MKRRWLPGIIMLLYGINVPACFSDTATLTISGTVAVPTCGLERGDDGTPIQQCGAVSVAVSDPHGTFATARGVSSEVIAVPGETTRKIILNRYD